MKKNISINLQGIIFHIEDDGYEVLSRYLQEVKIHFASYQGHEEIVADIEGRIAELFAARLSVSKQVITLADVDEMMTKMGRVSDFASPDEEEPVAAGPAGGTFGPNGPFGPKGPFGNEGPFGPKGPFAAGPTDANGQPRRLYRDLAHRKIAGVCAGLAQYFMVNPLLFRLLFLVLVLLPNLFRHRFPFPGVGLFDREFDLPGFAVVAYVILWAVLPKRDDAPEPIDTLSSTGPWAGRKLFRDIDTAKVGGVATGLAAYFQLDVTLVRILFLLGLFLGGSTLVLYLILWAVVPEARTVSEKMQMRGDAVTLSGIDNNLRSNAVEGESPAAPNRPVGTFLEGAARTAQPAVSFVGTLLRWGIAALLVFIGGSWLLSVLSLGAVGLGWLPPDAVIHGDRDLQFDGEPFTAFMRDVQPWGIGAAMLALGIPAVSLMLLGLRLLLRRSALGRSGNMLLLGLWVVGLVGAVAAGVHELQEFRSNGTYTTTRRLAAVPGPGIVLDARSMDDFLNDVSFSFAPTDSNAAPFTEETYRARGRTADAARLTAQRSVQYGIAQHDSTIVFDQGLALLSNAHLRNQHLRLTLHLPLNKTYRLTPLFMEQLNGSDFTSGQRPSDDREHRARFTRAGKFTCLDCPTSETDTQADTDDADDGDEVVSLDVNGNQAQVRVNTDGDEPTVRFSTKAATFNTSPRYYGTGRKTLSSPASFSEIDAQSGIRLLVRQGSSYQVEAAGRPQDVDEMHLEISDNRLVVRPRSHSGFFSSFTQSSHPLLVTVTLPSLQYLKLSAGCSADVSGFHEDKLRLEASSGSSAALSVQVPRLELNMSSASSATLRGSATELDIDGSSASQVEALDLRANQVSLDLSSGSQASVYAAHELRADLSSGSLARYAGHPTTIQKDLSSGSTLESVAK